MNIEDMIWNGASEDEVSAALNKIYAEKQKQEEALRAQREKENDIKRIEALKSEGRAYLVNAIMAYGTAFGLIPVDYDLTQEELNEVEQVLIEYEKMIPLYVKLLGIDKKIEKMMRGEGESDEELDIDSLLDGLFGE